MPRISIGWLLVGLSACVDTELGDAGPALPCVAQLQPELAYEGVVLISSELPEGFLVCSGVAIAKTLVVTSTGCIFRPSTIGDPDELSDPEEIESSADALYGAVGDGACDPERGWAPLEDGSFAAAFGKPLELEQIAVYEFDALAERLPVQRVFTSLASSRCAPGIALLVLERELDVTPLPIRFAETSPGEAVALSGACVGPNFQLLRQEVTAPVEGVAVPGAMAGIPPRSLHVPARFPSLAIGGGVISPTTGALIGVLTSGAQAACEEPDSVGPTFAVRLAPFRGTLLGLAAEQGISLRAEPDPSVAGSSCGE